jgi:hypothetical protein
MVVTTSGVRLKAGSTALLSLCMPAGSICSITPLHEKFSIKNAVYFGFLATVEKMVDQYLIIRNMLQQADHAFSSSSSLITMRIRWPPNT